jgi:ferrous iron transport protein A
MIWGEFMKTISLDALPIDCNAKILNINCETNLKRRLLDLGFVKGTNIRPIFKSPFGNPIAYLIRGTSIAIRKDDSKNITVQFDGGNYGTFI